MIDAFTLLLSHGVILLAAWRLLPRQDLDRDPPSPMFGPVTGSAGDSADA